MRKTKGRPIGKIATAVNAGAPEAPDAMFATLVAAFAADPARAEAAQHLVAGAPSPRRRRFGSNALKANGRMFAMVSKGRLVLKLPRERVASLVKAGTGQYFDPGHGRLMKEWVALVGPEVPWRDLAREAHDFVAGLRG